MISVNKQYDNLGFYPSDIQKAQCELSFMVGNLLFYCPFTILKHRLMIAEHCNQSQGYVR